MKYYTPTKKDLQLGFECEMTYAKNEKSYNAYGEPYSNTYWIPTILDIETLHYVLTDKNSDVRVKYLHEQDILGLGFIKKSYNYNNFLESFL